MDYEEYKQLRNDNPAEEDETVGSYFERMFSQGVI